MFPMIAKHFISFALINFVAILCVGCLARISEGPAQVSLTDISATHFTTLRHPAYPRYGVRIKKTEGFCETTSGVGVYAGYVDVDARHLWFTFFQSRNDPVNDPVMLWINGGPGCTGTVGLFLEIGPCLLVNGTAREPVHNPYSFTNNASVIFLDQPVGAGISYAEHGEHVSTTADAAEDFVAFVTILFAKVKELSGLSLSLSGESYAGRMLPVFASAILDANARSLAKQNEDTIDLKSIIIVNGFTNYLMMSLSSHKMLCTNSSPGIPPLLPISTCVRMREAMPRCRKWYTDSCIDKFDQMSCDAAEQFCAAELAQVATQTGRNFYDLEEPCPKGTECALVKPWIADYLNRPDVQRRLGIDEMRGQNTTMTPCSDKIRRDFTVAGDQLHSSNPFTEEILHRGVNVLHLIGANDWICNHVANLEEADKLAWIGQAVFQHSALKEWTFEGRRAGTFKSAWSEGTELAFVTLDGAGHMAPVKKRRESLYAVTRWLHGTPLIDI